MRYTFINLAKLVGASETHELKLTEQELKVTPNVISINHARCTFIATKLSDGAYMIDIDFDLSVNLIDDHDLKTKVYSAINFDEIIVSRDEDIETDILPESDGSYDFTSICLALFYDTVPYNFSTEELTKTEIEGVTIMSEEEFNKTHAGNAFSRIDFHDEE